jgi:hypothetical protein
MAAFGAQQPPGEGNLLQPRVSTPLLHIISAGGLRQRIFKEGSFTEIITTDMSQKGIIQSLLENAVRK